MTAVALLHCWHFGLSLSFRSFDFLIPDAPELIANFLDGEQDASCKRNAFMMLIHADQVLLLCSFKSHLQHSRNCCSLLALASVVPPTHWIYHSLHWSVLGKLELKFDLPVLAWSQILPSGWITRSSLGIFLIQFCLERTFHVSAKGAIAVPIC